MVCYTIATWLEPELWWYKTPNCQNHPKYWIIKIKVTMRVIRQSRWILPKWPFKALCLFHYFIPLNEDGMEVMGCQPCFTFAIWKQHAISTLAVFERLLYLLRWWCCNKDGYGSHSILKSFELLVLMDLGMKRWVDGCVVKLSYRQTIKHRAISYFWSICFDLIMARKIFNLTCARVWYSIK